MSSDSTQVWVTTNWKPGSSVLNCTSSTTDNTPVSTEVTMASWRCSSGRGTWDQSDEDRTEERHEDERRQDREAGRLGGQDGRGGHQKVTCVRTKATMSTAPTAIISA